MKNLFLGFIMCLMAIQMSAQNVPVTIKVIPASEAEKVSLYISPLTTETTMPIEMKKENNVYQAEVPVSSSDFYNVISVRNGGQMFFPIYGGKKSGIEIELNFSNEVPQLSKATAEDKALGQYFEYLYAKDKNLWTVPFTSLDDVRPFLNEYLQKADSLSKTNIDQKVADYLKMWGYTHTFDAYSALPMAAGVKLEDLPFKRHELLNDPAKVLNSSTAMLFRSTPQIVFIYLKDKRELNKCLTQLHDTYSEPSLLKTVTRIVVDNYLSTFDYEANFDKGLEELQTASKNFGLSESYAKNFAKRKATIKGQAFPTGVTLKDANGNVVDFSKFKGKYVYIDLWASWCGPCCKEVPILQELEKNLKNDKVEFVSISLDAKESQWKSKMQQLNMHGNQLIDSGSAFSGALNVRGIPFFVIYDPDGKLYMYDAPRPSQGPGLVELLENLK